MGSVLAFSSRIALSKTFLEQPNILEDLDKDDRVKISNLCFDDFAHDKQSRWKWERRNEAAMDLAMQVQKAKTFPWPGASNVVFPLITIAALQFSAKAYPALFTGPDVFRYRVIGEDDTGNIARRAERIGRHMSWQVMEQDSAWEEMHDRMLMVLSVMGSAFIKSFFDGNLGYNVSELVLPQDLVVNYYAKSIETADRKTELIMMSHNDIYTKVKQGVFDEEILNSEWYSSGNIPTVQDLSQWKSDNRRGMDPPPSDSATPFQLCEQHRLLDLDQDGYAEPYIVTFERSSRQLCRVVPRFTPEMIERNRAREVVLIHSEEYYTKYSFIPSPDRGIYDLGFGTFLGPINESVNTSINQLIDNGTIQNSMGGFLGRGVKIRGGVYTLAPWEWKRIDSYGDDIKKNMVPFPERAPSDVLFKLLGLLIEYASRVAGTIDEQVGKNPGQNTPASTFQGMQEQGAQVFGMIYTRVWRSLRKEAQKLYALNRQFSTSVVQFGAAHSLVRREDYLGSPDLVAPVANPIWTSTVMRQGQALAVKQSSMMTPGYDRDEVEKEFLAAHGIEDSTIQRIFLGSKKTGPLPNPKVQVEQFRLQGIQLKVQAEKVKWANELLEQRRVNTAQIHLLYAQAAKAMADSDTAKRAQQLAEFETGINMRLEQDKILNDRMKMLLGASGDTDGDNGSGGGGVQGMDQPPGNAAGAQGTGGRNPDDEGAMGGQGVPAQ